MATGGGEGDPHQCSICLNSYRNPKFLVCFHTFCADCIQSLVDRRPGGSIHCPDCGALTTLPPGGVPNLETNYYVQSRTAPQTADPDDTCKIHPGKKLEFYCVKCDQTLCLNCKLTDHEEHRTQDLTTVAFHKKKELETRQKRLQTAVTDVTTKVTLLKKDKQALYKKRRAVEKEIHNQHATVVAIVNKLRDEELMSLEYTCRKEDQAIDRELEQHESHLQTILNLQQQVDSVLTCGSPAQVIAVATERRASEQAVSAVTTQEPHNVRRPVLHFSVSTDDMVKTTRHFLGTVRTVEMGEVRDSEVRVTERFRCAQSCDVEVFSLCHQDRDPPRVILSFARCGMEKVAPVKVFTEEGECVFTGSEVDVRKMSYKRYAKGHIMHVHPVPGELFTFNKSPKMANICLRNSNTGNAEIINRKVMIVHPLQVTETVEFRIKLGPHRAFDVSQSQEHYVVVEEGAGSSAQRTVRLFRRSEKRRVSTYSPPTAQFQPSDVCFSRLGGREVLLVTDELNDAIHVVAVQGRALRFERYLCPGCPSLIHPTAITVDIHDRLWVACRGGAVLMLEQI